MKRLLVVLFTSLSLNNCLIQWGASMISVLGETLAMENVH